MPPKNLAWSPEFLIFFSNNRVCIACVWGGGTGSKKFFFALPSSEKEILLQVLYLTTPFVISVASAFFNVTFFIYYFCFLNLLKFFG